MANGGTEIKKKSKQEVIDSIKTYISDKEVTLDEIVTATGVSRNTAFRVLKQVLGVPGNGRGNKRVFTLQETPAQVTTDEKEE